MMMLLPHRLSCPTTENATSDGFTLSREQLADEALMEGLLLPIGVIYGPARRMALTAARDRGWRVMVDEAPGGAWLYVGMDAASAETLHNVRHEPRCVPYSLSARLRVMGDRLTARASRTGTSCACAIPVCVLTATDCAIDDETHATVVVLHVSGEGAIRWAYYDPHGAHADDVARARYNVGRLCASLGYAELPCRVRGRSWEASVQTRLPLCMLYTWLFVYALAYNGPDSTADVMSQFHDPERVAHIGDVVMRRWVPQVLWQTHRGKRVLGPGARANFGGDAVVVRRLCRKTRTYQVADRLSAMQSIPFLWIRQKGCTNMSV
jgi:hypothetical protein